MSNCYNNNNQQSTKISKIDITDVNVDGFSIALFIQIASSYSPCQEHTLPTPSSSPFHRTPSSSIDNGYSCNHSANQDLEIEIDKSTSLNTQMREEEDQEEEENQDDSSLNNQNNDNDYNEDDDNDHFAVKKSNIMKNILKSFQRFIEGEKDQERQKELCKLANKTYNFSQLKKLINRNLKAYGKRWNMKAKHMIEKPSSNMLLKYYLENINSIWLDKSKVQDKNEHLFVVNFMLQAIENPNYSQKIHFYQKKKSIIRSSIEQ